MNKYQLAAIALAGKNFGKQLMTDRRLQLEWGWDDEEESHDPYRDYNKDPLDEEKARKSFYRSLTPDSAMHSFGDSTKFTAFIYSTTNTLFCQPGSEYHGEGLTYSELREAKKEPKGTRFLFGRFGKTRRGGGFITVWRTAADVDDHESHSRDKDHEQEHWEKDRVTDYDPDTYYDLKLGDTAVLKQMLKSMVQGSARIVGESPAEYPISDNYIYTDGDGINDLISSIVGHIDMPKPDNECFKMAKINVRGRDMPLGAILGNFHMVRGPELEYMKGAVCNEYDRLKRQLTASKCTASLSLLQDIWDRMGGCPGDNKAGWDKLKNQGAMNYRNDLKKIFSNPDSIDTEFRGSQKDIDAAWDFLNRREYVNYGSYVQKLMESRKHGK